MMQKVSSLFNLSSRNNNFLKIDEETDIRITEDEYLEKNEEHQNVYPTVNKNSHLKQADRVNVPKIVVIFILTLICLYLYGFLDFLKNEESTNIQKDSLTTDPSLTNQQPPQQISQTNSVSDSSTIKSTQALAIQDKKVQPKHQSPSYPQNGPQRFIPSSEVFRDNKKSVEDKRGQKQQKQDEGISEQDFYEEMVEMIKPYRVTQLNLKEPELYVDIFKIPKSKELPFCFVIRNVVDEARFLQILRSIKAQNYSNIQIVYSGPERFNNQDKKITYNDVDKLKRKEIYATKILVEAGCSATSIIVPIRGPIRGNLLKKLNILYQRQNIWLTYETHENSNYSSVSSFYYRLLTQITFTDITNFAPEPQQIQLEKFAFSMILLAKYHAQIFPISWIYSSYPENDGIAMFKAKLSSQILPYNRSPLMYLQPNHQTEDQVVNYLSQLTSDTPILQKYKPRNHITLKMMMKALEYYSLKDFPKNHTLFQRQLIDYEQKYQLSKYKREVPLCIIILSRNNIEYNRYKKVLQSIKMQNYSNYHIVFTDDASTDQTFKETANYMNEIGLTGRSDLIRNEQQKFATYNIQNAVHNYCRSREVAVLIDGDDELIGRQVFKLINYGYQERDNWLVYFTFFSSIYMYGVSQDPAPQFFQYEEPRRQFKVISALRTFYVDLYRKIDMKDHQDDNGQFFDKLYDDAMQHPLMEMSGPQHTRYIPEIVYFYNQDYSGNDESTHEGKLDQQKHERQVISRPKYKKLQSLFST